MYMNIQREREKERERERKRERETYIYIYIYILDNMVVSVTPGFMHFAFVQQIHNLYYI